MLTPKENKKLQAYINGIDVKRLSGAFDALGEPNRCLIFRALLKDEELNVSDLARVVNISESLASQHLRVLLIAELVERTKKGKNVFYAVNHKDKLVDALQKVVEN